MITLNEIQEIERIYELYGFTKAQSKQGLLVFTYSNGYFYNAEMVLLNENMSTLSAIKKEYEDLGYSVREIVYKSLEEMHKLLFKGFFCIDKVQERLKKDYLEFCKLQSSKLFHAEYQYVEPSFFWNDSSEKGDLIERILEQMYQEGSQLIILEAAAGYGKTCTSYELIREMSELTTLEQAPIFIELSKNRKASLFRYVLLDEIDKKFTSLSSQLVIHEIQNGKVPLIIDGFDELISRSYKTMNSSNLQDEEAQTMLDTIADLFTEGGNTKVILTSRKSAIFTGDIFRDWVERRLSKCNVTRVSIEEPTINDWLGYERTQHIKNQKIPFAGIINPILLAFMKSMGDEDFKKQCDNAENVIKFYFTSLLERERGRHSLQMTVDEQYDAMKQLACDFVVLDIVGEELAFIKDLFVEINHAKFHEYRDRYIDVEQRPTEEEFANKLAEHALLDRISPNKNTVGFINDFIFGIFIGEVMIEHPEIIPEMDSKYIDIACTAYASRNVECKNKLLMVVSPYLERLNYEQQFEIELKLSGTIQQEYTNHYFANHTFHSEIYFDGAYHFQNCTFRNCTFNECIIMTSAFKECSFSDCRFYNVVVLRDTSNNCNLVFYANCIGHEEFFKEASYVALEGESQEKNYQKAILRKYWGSGGRYSRGRLPEIMLLRTQDAVEREGLEEALDELRRNDFLSKEGHYWFINKEKIKEIKEILEN